jgi:hypothetical protein
VPGSGCYDIAIHAQRIQARCRFKETTMERPEFIRHWTELENEDNAHYKGSTELMGIGAPLARKLGLQRICIHHNR